MTADERPFTDPAMTAARLLMKLRGARLTIERAQELAPDRARIIGRIRMSMSWKTPCFYAYEATVDIDTDQAGKAYIKRLHSVEKPLDGKEQEARA